MLVLALDTSSPAESVAILRDGVLIGTVFTRANAIHASRIFRHLDFLLTELSLRLDQIDLFTVAAGPGSFTGLRVGLAAVKGWSEAYEKRLVAVSALEAAAAQASSAAPTTVPVIDARRAQVYFGFYRRADDLSRDHLVLDGHECVASPEQFLEAVQLKARSSPLTIVTPNPEPLSTVYTRLETTRGPDESISIEIVSQILAPHVGRIGYLRAQRGETSDALTLDANYIRRSDAELHWKGSAGS